MADYEALGPDPDLQAEIDRFDRTRQPQAGRAVENIRKYRILPHDFTIAGGEMTPTLKVKRNVVNGASTVR